MRASGTDDKATLPPPIIFSLEEALEYIKEDEYVEVTPKNLRMRKIILDENERKEVIKNKKISPVFQVYSIKKAVSKFVFEMAFLNYIQLFSLS